MPRLSNTGKIDPLLMRNDMRDAVVGYFRKLVEAGLLPAYNPLSGLSGTELLPWYSAKIK